MPPAMRAKRKKSNALSSKKSVAGFNLNTQDSRLNALAI